MKPVKYQSVEIAGIDFHLQLDNKHEHQYARTLEAGAGCIDSAIFREFGQTGDTVLDAGANIGFVSLRLLELGAGHIHAFEPVPSLFLRLAQIAHEKVSVYPFALGAAHADQEITLSTRHHQGNSLNAKEIEDHPHVFAGGEKISVPVRRLDDLFRNTTFDFMKVDIEGSEAAFLNGAETTFKDRKPRAIQLELREHQFREAKSVLERHYGRIFRVAYSRGSRTAEILENAGPEASHPLLENIPPIYVFSD